MKTSVPHDGDDVLTHNGPSPETPLKTSVSQDVDENVVEEVVEDQSPAPLQKFYWAKTPVSFMLP